MDAILRAQILAILDAGQDMTLATVRPDGAPQATTVSYVADGLRPCFGCWTQSQKARNIAHDDRVSLTIDLPYERWAEIRGLSLFGRAERVTGAEQDRLGRLFLERFPEMAAHPVDESQMAVFRVTPVVVSILDYRKGFGHTDLVTIEPADIAVTSEAAFVGLASHVDAAV